jgi:5-methyltetrahydropteroyltriglutamate--homocysteine methyltransferase
VLPFANPRHAHEFRCFKKFALVDDQVLVAGVIDSLTNFIEHPEVVADRLERVTAVVGNPTRVLAGTDCGFDTSAGLGACRRGCRMGEARQPARRRPPCIAALVQVIGQEA